MLCRVPVETGPAVSLCRLPNLVGTLYESGLVSFAKEPEGFMGQDQFHGEVFVIDGEFEFDEFPQPLTGDADIGLTDLWDVISHDILLSVFGWPLKGPLCQMALNYWQNACQNTYPFDLMDI
jgi:hypothetical protein